MVGSVPSVVFPAAPPAVSPSISSTSPVPFPRRPLGPDRPAESLRGWYENELGWPTVPGEPVRLRVGVLFDVLDVPAEAGHAARRHLAPGSPVAVRGDRMRLLVAAGSAEELPGILRWLEWDALPLDLTATGVGEVVEAPLPPGRFRSGTAVQGAAVWVRPPVGGCEFEASLPTMSALGDAGGAPDLVRLVDTLATHCHRARLRRACAQPLAFS
ncbi:SCO3374 family protein [Streptomyces phaeoluteigriseus]|uniref:SCO3374 family protein n=1 Tax=Streptomyces phaeoluteigriseus TaxID=114686 RepID=A0ABY4Z1V7_9ACTN|nr:SCO3374 family protein [Streptomyces phaeoluteigriseus]USQ82744.1 SCO3374 family protein [Streptomyces phaeoluteigriseus]